MRLQDHFCPPLSTRRHWHAFHNAWATYIASDLNSKLPENYFAEPNVQYGIEVDVATFEEFPRFAGVESAGWSPPQPTDSLLFSPTDETVEIGIFGSESGPVLAGAIELVSPANKDRASHREAFVSKCETYLRQGIGLVIVDVVTIRRANLHGELIARLSEGKTTPENLTLYAAAYRPVERDKQICLDMWIESLAINEALHTLPLWLRHEICVPLDLAATYERTCREQRITVA